MKDFFYKKLDAYKVAKDYTIYVYSLVGKYPAYEQYALCDQLRRSAVSVPSNIAEGMGRMAVKERIHFLEISYASMIESLCQLDISYSLGYINEEELCKAEEIAEHLSRIMSGLRKNLTGNILDIICRKNCVKCPYYNGVLSDKRERNNMMDIEELFKNGKLQTFCPYYQQIEIAKSYSDIIFMPFE